MERREGGRKERRKEERKEGREREEVLLGCVPSDRVMRHLHLVVGGAVALEPDQPGTQNVTELRATPGLAILAEEAWPWALRRGLRIRIIFSHSAENKPSV